MNAIIANRLNFTRRLNTPAGIFDTQRPRAIDYQSVMVLKQQHCLALIPLYWMSDVHMTHTPTGGERYEDGYKETVDTLTSEFSQWADQYTNRGASLEVFDSMEEFHDAYGQQGFDFVKFWRPESTSKALRSCSCGSCEYAVFHLPLLWDLMETDIDQICKAMNLGDLASAGITILGEESAKMRIKRVVSKMLLTHYSYPVWCLWRTRLCIRVGEVVAEDDAPMFLNADRCICCAYSFLPSDARYSPEKFCKNGTEVCKNCYETRIIPTSGSSAKWEGNVCLTGNHDSPEVKAMLQTMVQSLNGFWETMVWAHHPDFLILYKYFGLCFKNPIPTDYGKIMRKGSMIDLSKLFYAEWKGEWMEDAEQFRSDFLILWERYFCLGQGCWDVMYSKCIQRVGNPPKYSSHLVGTTADAFKQLYEEHIVPELLLLFRQMHEAIDAKAEVQKTAEALLLAEGNKKEKKVREKTDKELQAEATRLANQVQKQKKKDAEEFALKAEKAFAKRKAEQAEKAKKIAKAKKMNILKCAGLL